MERDTPPVRRPGEDDLVSRDHWIVPVHGLNRADPEGIVQAVARPDGTVILHLSCGDSMTTVRFDVSRAAQLSTGIWEAAGAAQQLTGYFGDNHSLAPPTRPRARRLRSTPVHNGTVLGTDDMCAIGQRIRRIRHTRDKSLQVIAGLAGMGKSTLHRIERGERELTLSEIVALANALETAPSTLIRPLIQTAGHDQHVTGQAARTSSEVVQHSGREVGPQMPIAGRQVGSPSEGPV